MWARKRCEKWARKKKQTLCDAGPPFRIFQFSCYDGIAPTGDYVHLQNKSIPKCIINETHKSDINFKTTDPGDVKWANEREFFLGWWGRQ